VSYLPVLSAGNCFFFKSGSIFQGLVLCFGEGLIAGGLSSCLLLVFPFKDNMP